jgi:hypothetical protein
MGSIEGEQPTEQKPTPFNLTDIDRQVLSQTDEEFIFHDWEDLKGIIGKFIVLRLSPTYITPPWRGETTIRKL